MKKVVQWTIYGLALAAIATVVVCYSVFPTETKQAINKIMQYANTPIGIAGFSTTVGGALIFVVSRYILGNTKYGRRELDSIKGDVADFKQDLRGSVEEYKQKFDELKTNLEGQAEDLRSETEGKISILYNEFTDLRGTLLGSLKAFPNKHIQELVAQYESKFKEREAEIIEKSLNTNEFIDKKIAEIKAQYESMFEDLFSKVERTLNEEAADN